MSKTYAGIGSRQTPAPILDLMHRVAIELREQGWILRSGHAQGADQAFESGAGTLAHIYLPWSSFNEDVEIQGWYLKQPTAEAEAIARRFHPAWDRLRRGGRALQARNTHQVLGADCLSPCKFVLCWTPEGKASGGTGQAIRLAQAHGIEVFDLALPDVRERVEKFPAALV